MKTAMDSRRAHRIRIAWWTVFGVLVAMELLLLPLHLPTNIGGLFSYLLTYFTPMFLAIGASTMLAHRLRGVERRFWGLLALAASFLVIPEAYWTFYETWVDFRGPQVPSWFELGHLAAIIVFFVLLVSMTEFGEAPIVTRLRLYLDVLGAAIVAFAAGYWLWTLPVFVDLPMGRWPVAVIAAMYPVSGGVILMTTALIVVGWKAYRWRVWERLVSAAFVLYGLPLMAFPPMYSGWITSPVAHGFDWYTIVLGFGFFMMFMAAVYRATSDDGAERAEPWSIPEMHPVWLPMLYPSLLALALLAMGLSAVRVADTAGGFVLVVTTAMLAVVLILRSWLSSVELAHHRTRSITDAATATFNQRYLYDRLPRELADAGGARRPVSAIAFDVVDFRNIERMAGAEEGARVLVELAETLRAESPAGSTVYRVGSDEFVVIAPDLPEADAVSLAHRVNAHVASTLSVDGAPITLSAGVAVFPVHGGDADALVSHALASQQLARSAERADVVVFDADVVDAADPLVRLERARKQSHRAKLRALASAVDARDADTQFHSEVVNEIVSAFALVLELSDEQTRVLETAALVHDIGKIGVPDDVLLKPGQLSAAERTMIEEHPILSERLLRPADMPEILFAVRHHHERWDGTGYPDGLMGEQIPFEARVLAICDAFDAMTNTRRYRPALSTAQALAEIERCSGGQFDPALGLAFSRMVVRMHGRALSKRAAMTRREMGLVTAD